MKNQVYIAGDMLTLGSQLLRVQEKNDLRAIGQNVYNPQDNKEINDKADLDNNDGLAEKIVKADTDAIFASDKVVIEPQPFALGTMVELGQIKGMKDVSKKVNAIIHEGLDELTKEVMSLSSTQHMNRLMDILEEVAEVTEGIEKQKVYPHYEDIRRFDGVTETGDRRSLGINQYVYGVALDVSGGKGFYEWNEIINDIAKGDSE